LADPFGTIFDKYPAGLIKNSRYTLKRLQTLSAKTTYQYFTASRRNLQAKKEEALNLMDKGLLGGHNKEIAPMRGSRHREYSKKGSNSQELPPAPEQGKSILLDL